MACSSCPLSPDCCKPWAGDRGKGSSHMFAPGCSEPQLVRKGEIDPFGSVQFRVWFVGHPKSLFLGSHPSLVTITINSGIKILNKKTLCALDVTFRVL